MGEHALRPRALPDWQRRLLVACGAGAGMAAVYNIPLGGALFALEVLLGTLTLPLVLPALASTLIATAVAWIALPHAPTYEIPHYEPHASQIVLALLAGPLAGVVAVAWIRLVAAPTACARAGAAADARPAARVRRASAPWRSPTRSCSATANRSSSSRSTRRSAPGCSRSCSC